MKVHFYGPSSYSLFSTSYIYNKKALKIIGLLIGVLMVQTNVKHSFSLMLSKMAHFASLNSNKWRNCLICVQGILFHSENDHYSHI